MSITIESFGPGFLVIIQYTNSIRHTYLASNIDEAEFIANNY